MTVTEMDAAVDAQMRDEDEHMEVEFDGLLDEDGNTLKVKVRSMTGGQGVALMNLMNRLNRRGTSDETAAKLIGRFAMLIVSLVVEEEDRDYIEDEMALGNLNAEHLIDFWRKIAEADAGRPTESRTDSSRTPSSPGPSSPAKSQRRVPASKRSPSGGSAT